MSTAATQVQEALQAALRTIGGVRVFRDGSNIDAPPAAYVGPPSLTWSTPCSDPTEAVFTVYVVVAANDRAQERLLELVPQVAEAVDQVPDAVVQSARPGFWRSGAAELPTYEITVNASLF